MKIAVVGCGAVGSYYGAMLCRAGRDVYFLLRSDYETVRQRGVTIHSPAGDFNTRPHTARAPEEIGVSDLVLIALKTTANDQFPKLLPPLVGPHTAVVTLQNGLGNEEQLAKLFPVGQILGGLCFVGLNRTAPGVIQHLGEGRILLGEFQRWPEPRTHDIASLFRHAGVVCKVTDNLARAHWEKLVWNIPFNGLGVASAAGYGALVSQSPTFNAQPLPCLASGELLDRGPWEKLVRELMLETIAAANALGHQINASLADNMIERTRGLGAYKASTILDFEAGRSLEVESLFLAPLRLARQANVPTPRMKALCEVLTRLDAKLR
ncbi:MAG: 2-dehydropantoate 2-reductase [Verrucomicrobia bacterium]|nr:MAG: 2-dehydropantoate 2-reductase [Verrucomicrobiota bacterium]